MKNTWQRDRNSAAFQGSTYPYDPWIGQFGSSARLSGFCGVWHFCTLSVFVTVCNSCIYHPSRGAYLRLTYVRVVCLVPTSLRNLLGLWVPRVWSLACFAVLSVVITQPAPNHLGESFLHFARQSCMLAVVWIIQFAIFLSYFIIIFNYYHVIVNMSWSCIVLLLCVWAAQPYSRTFLTLNQCVYWSDWLLTTLMIYDYSITVLVIFLRIAVINIATSNLFESEGVIAAKLTRLFKTVYKLVNSLLRIYAEYCVKYVRKRCQRQFVTFHRELD